MGNIERWACPQHPGEKVKFNGGRLWCLQCRRELPDAIKVVILPAADYRGAVDALRDLADAAHRDRMGSPLPYEEWRLRYDTALTIAGGR
jgi:hypothetical protein